MTATGFGLRATVMARTGDSPSAAGARGPELVRAAAGEAGDAELVRAAAGGDRAAFGALYERFARVVHGVLLAHLHSAAAPDDAADLVQDVFLVAMERLSTLRDPAAFGGWVAAIARNQARMWHRRSPRRAVPLPDDLPAPADAEPGEDGAAVLAAIRALPEAYREPLVLRLVEGLSGAEIAERTGMTPGSVRVNLHRGMARLRARLGREHD